VNSNAFIWKLALLFLAARAKASIVNAARECIMQNVADLGSLISTAIHPTSLDATDQGSFGHELSTSLHEFGVQTSTLCSGQVISQEGLRILHPVSTDWVRRLTHLLPPDGSAFALACTMCV
jgi:hypothetical protein